MITTAAVHRVECHGGVKFGRVQDASGARCNAHLKGPFAGNGADVREGAGIDPAQGNQVAHGTVFRVDDFNGAGSAADLAGEVDPAIGREG
ncbi:hypothetical protein D3C78_1618550 [compost metagenome]